MHDPTVKYSLGAGSAGVSGSVGKIRPRRGRRGRQPRHRPDELRDTLWRRCGAGARAWGGGFRRQGLPVGPGRARTGGATHVIDLLIEELNATSGQLGARTVAEAAGMKRRHTGAMSFAD